MDKAKAVIVALISLACLTALVFVGPSLITPTVVNRSRNNTQPVTFELKVGKVNVAVEKDAITLLKTMEDECIVAVPSLHRQPFTSATYERRRLKAIFQREDHLLVKGVTCADSKGHWWYYHSSNTTGNVPPQPISWKRDAFRNQWEVLRNVVIAPAHNTSWIPPDRSWNFLEAVNDALLANDSYSSSPSSGAMLRFHRTIAMLNIGFHTYDNIYHFIVDFLFGAVSVILSNPDILMDAPRTAMTQHEMQFMDYGWKCTPFVESVVSTGFVVSNQPTRDEHVLYGPKGPFPGHGKMNCFCGMMHVHHMGRRYGRRHKNHNQSHEVHLLNFFRDKIVERFKLRPYSEAVQYDDYARYGFWLNATDPSKRNRMLFIRRKTRVMAYPEKFVEIATRLGFVVESVYFDNCSLEVQAAAGRYTDVMVGSHGAGMTWMLMMNEGFREPNNTNKCRVVIELVHWVIEQKMYMLQRLAAFSNLVPFFVSPVNATFDPALVPGGDDAIKAILKSPSGYQHIGHKLQTAFYDMGHFERVLEETKKLLWDCPSSYRFPHKKRKPL